MNIIEGEPVRRPVSRISGIFPPRLSRHPSSTVHFPPFSHPNPSPKFLPAIFATCTFAK